jgi:hypothetical protein
MSLKREIKLLISEWDRKHGKSIAESRLRMEELLTDWDFLDSNGAITVPYTDTDITAKWDADVIRNLQAIADGECVVDLRQCPIRGVDWVSHEKAMDWLEAECVRANMRPWPKWVMDEFKAKMASQGASGPDEVFVGNLRARN